MKFKKSFLTFIVVVATSLTVFSLPVDSLEMQEKIAMFQDAVKSKQYSDAANYLHWILQNKPRQHVSIYILGADVLDEIAKAEKDPVQKKKDVDSLMILYDLRLKFYKDSANVINRKALASYRYNINGPDPDHVLELMDETFRLNGVEVLESTLVPYMQAIALTKVKKKTLTQDEILARYDNIMSIIDAKTKLAQNNQGKIEKLKNYRTEIDELILKVVKVDCEFVHMNLAIKYKNNPTDLELAKKIFSYLLNGSCEKDSLWLTTGEFIYSKEPSFGLAKHLGLQYFFSEDFKKAQYYAEESMRYAPTASDSADVYIVLGSLSLHQNNRLAARAAYRNAIRADSKHVEAFEKIGDLYYNSFKECSQEKSMADDRATYLVAYDYYERAGNKEKIEMTRKLFPSREEIFLMNYHTGQTIQVGCWINETTVIRTRD
jgi:tetratricopeptide (TPR) repeat protein